MLWLSYVFICVAGVTASVDNPGKAPWVTLNDGKEMPKLALGTWLGFASKGKDPSTNEVQLAVEAAIDAGYRHIDTASIYKTEEQVGKGIKNKIDQGVVKREDLFVTTKLWNDAHAREAVVPTLQQSLKELGLEYVDLYLIHWPVAQYHNLSFYDTDYLETWKGMEDAKALNLTRSIGVSNFNSKQLQRLMDNSSEKPAALQVEVNLNLQQPKLREFCRQHNIVVMGYTPFGSLFPSKADQNAPPPRVDDPALVKMADKYNKTVTQINLKYLVDLDVVPLPKSVTKSRVEENIDVFDFELSDEDRELLKSYDKGYRTITVNWWKQSPYYPFGEE